jgi:ribose transport system substrate-binding protein
MKRGVHIGKRWALLLLVALLGVIIASQASAAPKAVKDLKVGVSMYTLGAPYFAAQADSIKKHGEELGLKVVVTNANDDMTKQLNDVRSWRRLLP